MVWSLALRPDDAKQDPVVYGAEFGVEFLAEGPRIASIQEGIMLLKMYTQSCGRKGWRAGVCGCKLIMMLKGAA